MTYNENYTKKTFLQLKFSCSTFAAQIYLPVSTILKEVGSLKISLSFLHFNKGYDTIRDVI